MAATNTTVDCSDAVIEAVFSILFTHGVFWTSAFLLFIAYKIIKVYDFLIKNPIFGLYYFFLITGTVLFLACESYGLGKILQGTSYFFSVLQTVNLLITLGSIFLDVFLTLVPNFYFSLVHSKLNEVQSHMSRRYFYINLVVSIVFIAFMPIACYTLNPIAPNIAQILELVYTLCFYAIVLKDFRSFEGKHAQVLWTFFIYYIFYAVMNIVANVFRALDQIRKTPQEIISSMMVHHILYSTNLVILILCLNKMKWKPETKKRFNETSSRISNQSRHE